jgi:hypothetical protein
VSAEPAGRTRRLRERLARPVDCAAVTALGCVALALAGAPVPGLAGLLAAAAAIGVLAGYAVSGSV